MSWSKDYKKSIDCNNPSGFSQKAHCAARKKRARGEKTKSKSPFNEMHEVKSHKSVEKIAKKHRLEVSFIKKQLEMGIPIEHEHTKDKDLATDIALQHLDEIPDYYTRLRKMESSAKKEHKKFKDIEEGTLHHWFHGSKSKSGKPGWVQADGSPCANEPGETKTPKCFSSGRLKALKRKGKKGKSLIRSAVRRKRQKDKTQQAKSGSSAPTNVPTFAKGKKDPNYVKAEPGIKEAMEFNEAKKDKPGKGSGTKDACYYKVRARYDVWPSAYASGALVKCRRVGAANWGTQSEETQMIRYCPKCKKDEMRSECKYGEKFWDMYSVPSKLSGDYHPNSPHPGNFPESYDHEYSMARSELATIVSATKRLRKKMKGEGNIEAWVQSKITKAADYLDAAADYVDSGEMKEQVKPVDSDFEPFSRRVKSAMTITNPSTRIKILRSANKLYPKPKEVDEQMLPPIDPEAHKKAQKTQKLFNKGTSTDNPNEKEIFLKRTGPQLPLVKKETKTKTQVAHYEPDGEVIDEKCWDGYIEKGMKKKGKRMVPNCVKTEEYSNWREELFEQKGYVMPSASQSGAYSGGSKDAYRVGDTIPASATKPKPSLYQRIKAAGDKYGKKAFQEDWQKVNRQDKTDGLSQKAVDTYRRENPGSKLQTAVTEKKPKGKRAKRRANFCHRMKGMKSKLTSAKTARDPNSRINKALRRWNCN